MYSRMGLSELEEKRKRVNDLTQWLTAEVDRRERTYESDGGQPEGNFGGQAVEQAGEQPAETGVLNIERSQVALVQRDRQTVDPFKAHLKEQLRQEVASELGIDVVREGYFGGLTNSQCGKFGAVMQKRMVQLLENRHMPKN